LVIVSSTPAASKYCLKASFLLVAMDRDDNVRLRHLR